MNKKSETFLVTIPIIRKNYEETKSAKFKGNLQLISNEYGVIYDWKIFFSHLSIDVFTTPSWFGKKNHKLFNYREKLFKKLNIIQEKRPSSNKNKIIKLSNEQIKIVNNFFNNREDYGYKSSIKNIVGILKGNSPCGEAKKPKSAEMILDGNSNIKNFVILIDDLCRKNMNHFDAYSINSKEIGIEDFVKLNESIKTAFKIMQRDKGTMEFGIYLKNIKEYYKKHDKYLYEVEIMAKKKRTKFSKNVDNKYKNYVLPFGFNDSSEYEKCHIYEYWKLIDLAQKCMYENKKNEMETYLNMIADPENFIPLTNEIHRKFDKYYFTYNENGEIEYIKQNTRIDSRFYAIDLSFMTEKRKKYFNLRKEYT